MSRPEISPFYVMEVMKAAEEREAAGEDVLHLEVGQPSTSAAEGVIAAAERAMRTDRLGYTSALGIPELRARLAAHYHDWYGESVDPESVVVTAGASGACVLGFLAAFGLDDRVAVCEPGYPCYRNMLQAFDVKVAGLPVGPETRFQPTPSHLETMGDLAGLVVASPSNPTGTTLGSDEMATLTSACRARGVRLVSDEIYHGISYGEPLATAWASDRSSIVINSFSKYFSMTGWRLGWMLVPDDLHDAVERLAQNLFICPPTLAQHAALAAFDCGPELDRHVERYAENRQILLEGLPAAGLADLAPADGAFYVYADVSGLTDDAQELCKTWLDELGVAATPGIDFDPTNGHRYVRFSFAGGTDEITEAVLRLQRWADRG